jgi:hypothetical protein
LVPFPQAGTGCEFNHGSIVQKALAGIVMKQRDQRIGIVVHKGILKVAEVLQEIRFFTVRDRTDPAHRSTYIGCFNPRRTSMKKSTFAAATLTAVLFLSAAGCAVQRGQETMGAYVDDTGITSTIKTRFVESKKVDATAISVETMKGTVMLSGFAKNAVEKTEAEAIAQKVGGVRAVKNEIVVRP